MTDSRRWPRTRTTLVVGAALAVTAAAALGIAAEGQARPSELNYAYVDRTGTAAVAADVEHVVEKLFSFAPDTVAATESTARQTLRGDAVAQYDKLYGPLLSQARAKGLSMRTSVASVGVQELRENQATVLVFATQRGEKAGAGQPTLGGARVQLRLLHTDGSWRIISLTVL